MSTAEIGGFVVIDLLLVGRNKYKVVESIAWLNSLNIIPKLIS